MKVADERRNPFIEAARPQEMAVRVGRDGETIRHADACSPQRQIHLAERRILAADERHVAETDLANQRMKGEDVTAICGSCLRKKSRYWRESRSSGPRSRRESHDVVPRSNADANFRGDARFWLHTTVA